ncbi:efflux RND transporter periplasmic adaptor subunit [Saccharicrinis sp. FJH2]|uniref:efflux RND transporter periplasmic adaptor subunit n=1 Tax=Saccharicrinis sp. FJH65 TaxID=3344659 RepID=UPI0035F27928
MKKNAVICSLVITALLIAGACKNKTEDQSAKKNTFTEEAVLVRTVPVTRGLFYRELYNNGTLSAYKKATLTFRQNGMINAVYTENGARVSSDDVLVKIDDFDQRQALLKAEISLENSRISLTDALISAGYSINDSARVPENTMKSCLIKSGYNTAISNLEIARRNLSETTIRAPFDGIVANCDLMENNSTTGYKEACTIINDDFMDVEFNILETEYSILHKGLPVDIIPYAMKTDTFPGKIIAINPTISDNGMITVKTRIKNRNNRLIDGMNVQAVIKIALNDRIMVPSEAIVLRQEKKVVFTVKNDTAIWNYVEVGNENSRFSEIISGLKPGDDAIVSGQLNLAHLAKVSVSN